MYVCITVCAWPGYMRCTLKTGGGGQRGRGCGCMRCTLKTGRGARANNSSPASHLRFGVRLGRSWAAHLLQKLQEVRQHGPANEGRPRKANPLEPASCKLKARHIEP